MTRNSQPNRVIEFPQLDYMEPFVQRIYMIYTPNISFLIQTRHPLMIHMLLYYS